MASEENKAPAIGIDLGTTYSCVAVWQNNLVEIIPNDQGNRITPSCVAFTEHGRLVGDAAKNQTDVNPTNTVFAVKRLIGRRYSETSVQNDIKHWPFKVVAGPMERPKIMVNYRGVEKQFYAEEISSMILVKMKEVAEAFLDCTVNMAVITVPAYFNDSQRQATKNAGVIAGLNVIGIMDEPTAAAIAYGFDKIPKGTGGKNVLIFDLGGGTFDVSVLSIGDGNFVVRATAGDTHLGDEAVACGAAIRAANLTGHSNKDMQNLVLVDVTPLSLGVGKDHQTRAILPIYEGESADTNDNNLLGEFVLEGIDPAPMGVSKIDVCFDVDVDGILTVSAQDRSTGHKKEIVVSKQNGALTEEEIQTMVEEAAHYKAEDEVHKARISLENLTEKVKAMAMDAGLSFSEKKTMENEAENVIAWLDTHHHAAMDEINKHQKKLDAILQKLMKLKRGGMPYEL
ncbi:Heat shock 70 kDa protein [Rhynchospora pubera]|uniref:Heat shock 70 kDa protein n=2 Tax=Rhynchospora pubera TaxID=906938 RepID=A0AAV8CXA5_9POAL|nr:Heat shock 70 kDa protein [Rhynchospora pubera]